MCMHLGSSRAPRGAEIHEEFGDPSPVDLVPATACAVFRLDNVVNRPRLIYGTGPVDDALITVATARSKRLERAAQHMTFNAQHLSAATDRARAQHERLARNHAGLGDGA